MRPLAGLRPIWCYWLFNHASTTDMQASQLALRVWPILLVHNLYYSYCMDVTLNQPPRLRGLDMDATINNDSYQEAHQAGKESERLGLNKENKFQTGRFCWRYYWSI